MFVWAAHAEYWNWRSPVTIDGVSRRIVVNPGVTDIDIRTLWSRWIDWIDVANNDKFHLAMRVSGFDSIPGGRTGATFFLQNNWRLIVDLRKVKISGVLFSDDYDTAYFDFNLNPQYPAQVTSVVNTATTVQNVVTGNDDSIAAAVRAIIATELARIDAAISTRATVDAIPTASANAGAVRGELAAELAMLDAPVSEAGNPVGIAAAVRTELAAELEMLDAPVSEAGNPVEIAAAVRVELETTEIPVNVKKMNDAEVKGSGTLTDKWRGSV